MPNINATHASAAPALVGAIHDCHEAAARVEAQFRADVAARAPHWLAIRWDGNYEPRLADGGRVSFNLHELAVLLPDGTEHFIADSNEDNWLDALDCERDMTYFAGEATDASTVAAFAQHQADALGVSLDFLRIVGDAAGVLAQRAGCATRITFQPADARAA